MIRTAPQQPCSLGQLYTELMGCSSDGVSQMLDVVEQRLQHFQSIAREAGVSHDAAKIFSWLADAIHPMGDILIQDNSQQVERLLSRSSTAFECMQRLQTHFLLPGQVPSDALLSIIAYTSPDDPWTRETTQNAAEQILAYNQQKITTPKFLVEDVLVGYIRPLFSHSQTASITPQSRKATTSTMQKPPHQSVSNASTKPWKFREVSSMTVLQWTIKNMNGNIFQENWHLCIPPVLALLDDSSTIVRVRGLQILDDLLRKMPPNILQRTGLGDVFEDAVMPTLLFLPNLTPVEESVSLLTYAYVTLASLGEARFPTKEDRSEKMKLLDRIMRHGVLQGFKHSGDNVVIAELLVKEVIALFNSMGIHAVKYLKDTIPVLSKILTDPFLTSHLGLLLVTSRAIQSLVVNCWPRMREANHRLELVKALTLCWATVSREIEDDNGCRNLKLEEIRQELQLAGNILLRSVSDNLDMIEDLQPLIQADQSLNLLFNISGGLDTMEI